MPLDSSKPTFMFFAMSGCNACTQFKKLWSRLIKDSEVKAVVNLDRIEFGFKDGVEYELESAYPDFNIEYAPYLWLAKPYDESNGHHLNPATMHDKKKNTRQNGELFGFRGNTTYSGLKKWILEHATAKSIRKRY